MSKKLIQPLELQQTHKILNIPAVNAIKCLIDKVLIDFRF
jgi:hypothetical protein